MCALKTERCTTIFTDTASGKSLEGRPELGKAIATLAPRDNSEFYLRFETETRLD